MEVTPSSNGFEQQAISRDILTILEEMTSDWEMGFAGKIGPETRLVADLAFESIDVVQLAVSLQEHFRQPNLPFQKLLMTPEGRYVEDLQVSELSDFVYRHLNQSST
jgi:acyl carrier protein